MISVRCTHSSGDSVVVTVPGGDSATIEDVKSLYSKQTGTSMYCTHLVHVTEVLPNAMLVKEVAQAADGFTHGNVGGDGASNNLPPANIYDFTHVNVGGGGGSNNLPPANLYDFTQVNVGGGGGSSSRPDGAEDPIVGHADLSVVKANT